MRRFLIALTLVALAATPLAAMDAAGQIACCGALGAERTVTNLDNGVRVTLTASDPKVVAQLQEMSATCAQDKPCCKDCPMGAAGVTCTVAKTSSGVVVTATATDPELVKKLQAHAAAMAAGGDPKACCKGGAAGKCPHAKSTGAQT